MKENVSKALQNVEALGDLEDKSEQFEQQAKKFQKKAGAVKKMMRCRNWKTTALAVGICFIVVVIIISLIVVLTSDGSTEVPTSAPTPTAVAPTSAPPIPAAAAGRR
jgi:t-SNARE complex subunit (syntaxin)